MGLSRSRKYSPYIVISNTTFIQKLVSYTTTLFMWLYSLVIFYLFFSAVFDHNDALISIVRIALNVTNADIQQFLFECVLIFLGMFILLLVWRTYNKHRFGSLNRRHYPENTTDAELLNLGLISPIDFEQLQTQKISTFSTNPIIQPKKD